MHLDMQTQSEQSAAVQTEDQDGEERDLRDFAKTSPSGISESADPLRFSHITIFRVYRE